MTIANTKENNATVSALKKINETKWVGNTVLQTLEACLTSINLESGINSGWYQPAATTINGLTGIYMINQDGSLCYDFRVIKEGEKAYRIETLTSSGFNEFENNYLKFINQ